MQLITDPKNISILLPLVFTPNKQLAKIVASILHQILNQTPVKGIAALDERFAHVDSQKMTAKAINYLKLEDSVVNSMFALLAFHRNGYIREAAINQLSFDYPNITIPVLLIRANDWVNQIKDIAINKLNEFINLNNNKEFLPYLGLISQLQSKKRYDNSGIISLIENNLNRDCYKEYYKLLESNKDKSRVALRVAARDDSRLSELIKVSYLSHDMIVKLEILNIAKNQLSNQDLYDVLGKFLNDKAAVVRKKCIYIFLAKFPENATTVLTKILFDISFSLHELARFYLRQNKIQPTEIYKDALINHDRPLPIIIMGLAEAGHKDDFKLIEPYLNDSTVKVKSACIYAVFKLKHANRQQLILAQLPTAESMVIKTIYTGLVKYHDDYDIDAIKSIFCQENDMMAEFFFMKLKLSTVRFAGV